MAKSNKSEKSTIFHFQYLMGRRSSQILGEMTMSYFSSLILAIVLPSLRIFPPLNRAWLVAMGILSIVLLHTATLTFSVVYIQSIGSGMDIFSGLFILSLVPVLWLTVQTCTVS